MKKLRVLVVEDSLTVLRYLVGVLEADPEIEVVGECGDGKTAIELCAKLRPDVITLDMMLPTMTGLAATEYIMAHTPTPILIVSASTNRGELFRTYEALAAGAVDVLEKPIGDEPETSWAPRFLAAVKLVARIKVITHPRAKLSARLANLREPLGASPTRRSISLVAIGASTGGPAAAVEVLRALPHPFPMPVLLVIHIAEMFGAALADWLDGVSAHRVGYAREGDRLSDVVGRVVMAPPGRHLVVEGERLRLSNAPERHSCRPSVDVLFESIARVRAASCVACLMTGMGKDGASGLLDLRRAGALTIAQDERSCVVYGMPREAARLGAAELILPLSEIGPTLASIAKQQTEGRHHG